MLKTVIFRMISVSVFELLLVVVAMVEFIGGGRNKFLLNRFFLYIEGILCQTSDFYAISEFYFLYTFFSQHI